MELSTALEIEISALHDDFVEHKKQFSNMRHSFESWATADTKVCGCVSQSNSPAQAAEPQTFPEITTGSVLHKEGFPSDRITGIPSNRAEKRTLDMFKYYVDANARYVATVDELKFGFFQAMKTYHSFDLSDAANFLVMKIDIPEDVCGENLLHQTFYSQDASSGALQLETDLNLIFRSARMKVRWGSLKVWLQKMREKCARKHAARKENIKRFLNHLMVDKLAKKTDPYPAPGPGLVSFKSHLDLHPPHQEVQVELPIVYHSFRNSEEALEFVKKEFELAPGIVVVENFDKLGRNPDHSPIFYKDQAGQDCIKDCTFITGCLPHECVEPHTCWKKDLPRGAEPFYYPRFENPLFCERSRRRKENYKRKLYRILDYSCEEDLHEQKLTRNLQEVPEAATVIKHAENLRNYEIESLNWKKKLSNPSNEPEQLRQDFSLKTEPATQGHSYARQHEIGITGCSYNFTRDGPLSTPTETDITTCMIDDSNHLQSLYAQNSASNCESLKVTKNLHATAETRLWATSLSLSSQAIGEAEPCSEKIPSSFNNASFIETEPDEQLAKATITEAFPNPIDPLHRGASPNYDSIGSNLETERGALEKQKKSMSRNCEDKTLQDTLLCSESKKDGIENKTVRETAISLLSKQVQSHKTQSPTLKRALNFRKDIEYDAIACGKQNDLKTLMLAEVRFLDEEKNLSVFSDYRSLTAMCATNRSCQLAIIGKSKIFTNAEYKDNTGSLCSELKSSVKPQAFDSRFETIAIHRELNLFPASECDLLENSLCLKDALDHAEQIDCLLASLADSQAHLTTGCSSEKMRSLLKLYANLFKDIAKCHLDDMNEKMADLLMGVLQFRVAVKDTTCLLKGISNEYVLLYTFVRSRECSQGTLEYLASKSASLLAAVAQSNVVIKHILTKLTQALSFKKDIELLHQLVKRALTQRESALSLLGKLTRNPVGRSRKDYIKRFVGEQCLLRDFDLLDWAIGADLLLAVSAALDVYKRATNDLDSINKSFKVEVESLLGKITDFNKA